MCVLAVLSVLGVLSEMRLFNVNVSIILVLLIDLNYNNITIISQIRTGPQNLVSELILSGEQHFFDVVNNIFKCFVIVWSW